MDQSNGPGQRPEKNCSSHSGVDKTECERRPIVDLHPLANTVGWARNNFLERRLDSIYDR